MSNYNNSDDIKKPGTPEDQDIQSLDTLPDSSNTSSGTSLESSSSYKGNIDIPDVSSSCSSSSIQSSLHVSSPPPLSINIGDTLSERFVIKNKIGSGGFGIVYKAEDTKTGRFVALKIPHKQRKQLLIEAQTTALLTSFDHYNLVKLLDYKTHESTPYIVMEFLKGTKLSDEELPVPIFSALDYTIQLGNALSCIHTKMLHRDLKPSNIFVVNDAINSGRIKVFDFGLALEIEQTGAGQRCGTPLFMSPEQCQGAPQKATTDIWSLGIILYWMITGRYPFTTSAEIVNKKINPSWDPAIPGPIQVVLKKALQTQPKERYQTAGDVVEALNSVRTQLLEVEDSAKNSAPYRYLYPFTEKDSKWFFGREVMINELYHRVIRNSSVAVYGPSGAGKSSLIQAGLIHRLKLAFSEKAHPEWLILQINPAVEPIKAIWKELYKKCRTESESYSISFLQMIPELLGKILLAKAKSTNQKILFVVDQLEEILQFSEKTRILFGNCLKNTVDPNSVNVHLLVAFREDFRARLSPYFGWLLKKTNQSVDKPTTAEQIKTLVEPAKRAGYTFEKGLAEEIVQNVQNELTPLPLLQVVAATMWEKREGLQIPRTCLDQYDDVGGIIANWAEQAINEFTGEQFNIARDILVFLVDKSKTGKRRKYEELTDFCLTSDLGKETLQELIDKRLITSSSHSGEKWIGIVHDALAEKWERLSNWIKEDEELINVRNKLEIKAKIWKNAGQPSKVKYLLTDELLDDAIIKLEVYKNKLGKLITGHILVSQKIRKIKQQSERKREAAEKIKLQKESKRLKILLSVLAVFFLIATCLGIAFYIQTTKIAKERSETDKVEKQDREVLHQVGPDYLIKCSYKDPKISEQKLKSA